MVQRILEQPNLYELTQNEISEFQDIINKYGKDEGKVSKSMRDKRLADLRNLYKYAPKVNDPDRVSILHRFRDKQIGLKK